MHAEALEPVLQQCWTNMHNSRGEIRLKGCNLHQCRDVRNSHMPATCKHTHCLGANVHSLHTDSRIEASNAQAPSDPMAPPADEGM